MTSELPSEAVSNYPIPTLKVKLFYPATQATIKVLSLTFSYGYFFSNNGTFNRCSGSYNYPHKDNFRAYRIRCTVSVLEGSTLLKLYKLPELYNFKELGNQLCKLPELSISEGLGNLKLDTEESELPK